MRVGIIGAGNMGSAFARRLAAAGHDVAIASRDMSDAEQAAKSAGSGARAVPQEEIARKADVLIAATPFQNQAAALKASGPLDGKTVIEISNPVNEDLMLAVGHKTSAAEEIATQLPDAMVVKAFNTVFAQVLSEGPARRGDRRVQVFFAGDDETARRRTRSLIESLGFEPVDAGPLKNARLLEPLGGLNIYLGYVTKLGTDVAFGVRKIDEERPVRREDEVTLSPEGGVADRIRHEPRAR